MGSESRVVRGGGSGWGAGTARPCAGTAEERSPPLYFDSLSYVPDGEQQVQGEQEPEFQYHRWCFTCFSLYYTVSIGGLSRVVLFRLRLRLHVRLNLQLQSHM